MTSRFWLSSNLPRTNFLISKELEDETMVIGMCFQEESSQMKHKQAEDGIFGKSEWSENRGLRELKGGHLRGRKKPGSCVTEF